jgi:hypothetical protein
VDLSLLPRDGASLWRVRLHGGGDALRERQRLERLLGEVDWTPAGLGPRALLVVRRMAVDARRHFAPRAEGGTFARQVSGALRERAATARRPWLQRDAAMAEAVCFADEAELLACLWRDWSWGVLASHWWWAGVLKHRPAAPWLREQLFARGDRLVPAMALLAGQGDLCGCLQKLDEVDAGVALRAVQASHALALDAAAPRSSGAEPAAKAMAPQGQASAPQAAASRPRPSHALRQLVDAVPELRSFGTTSAARRLLAITLAVQRSPRWARSPALPLALTELEAWQMADLDAAIVASHVSKQPGRQEVPVSPATVAPRGVSRPSACSYAQAPEPLPAMPTSRRQSPPGDATTPPHETPQAVASPADNAPPDIRPRQPLAQGEAAPAVAAQPARRPAADQPAAAEAPASAVRHTGYCGLFYLLNIALAWRVYGDFTMPRHPGISLPPWDLLAWTGRAWFGPDFEADPLWPLLAELAGRDLPALPGDDFDDAPDWTAPADAVVDCAAALAESHPGRRWLQHWRLSVEARLRTALGCVDGIGGIELLCRHRAGIAVSEAAVDVTLSLAALPLPIRFAGLDRDPGWIPAAGRSVIFHFD